MASRTSESSYWDSQHLPHNQYNHSQHYSFSPAMVNQQQPRQTQPTFNSASSAYSTSPSTVYYGSSFYQQSPVNGMSGGPISNGNGHQGGGGGGPSSTFVAPNHGVNLSSSHVMAPYPMTSHSGYHLNNSGIYQRSHGNDFGGGAMTQGSEEMNYHHQQQHHHVYHTSSQHSGSPTIDGSEYGQGMKQKRRQVRNACVNCQKACKRCDEGRPCTRCIKYGLTDTCQDSSRKERKRGVKRGPYKRRATTGSQSVNGSSTTTIQYPQSSSPFMVMDNLQSTPFLHHHNSSSHASMSPHARNSGREAHSNLPDGGGSQILESNLLSSPAYPSSAPGTIQRSNNNSSLANNHDGSSYNNRDHFHTMQPPRFTSRYDYDRSSNSPAQSMYNNGSIIRQVNALPPPVSAPASSTSFSSSSRSLFSPPALLSANSANFLGANSHHRLHSDSLNTVNTNTTSTNSLSPRTPMSLSANGSGSMIGGELGLMGAAPQTLSANSSSSPGGIKSNNYIHHPGPTTTTNLPLTATGAFLNPSSAPSNNSQPFPLHIPHSARWRSNNISLNGERGSEILLNRNRDEKEEHLAPIKLHNSTDSDLSSGNLSIRYQLPSPRVSESPRNDSRNGNLLKVDLVA